jgi:two-component system, OmpR family, alkaline phosphatase synthesis response regulator PhoP
VKEPESNIPPSLVLIVDDNPQGLELLTAYVEDLPNITVRTATNGVEALDMISRRQPDLVLLDVMMPKMSGFEVCQRIKNDPKTRDIQVVMVTALNEVADLERAADCGTDDFLTKPIDRATLVTRVNSLLRVRHLKKTLN